MATGEIRDVERAFDTTLGLSDYLDLVRRKTSILFRLSCLRGVAEGGIAGEAGRSLGTFGAEVGVAFQVLDDRLDPSAIPIGKPAHAENPVTVADLVSCMGRGTVSLGIWLRTDLAVGHCQYTCQCDSPTWRCCAYSAGSPCSPGPTGLGTPRSSSCAHQVAVLQRGCVNLIQIPLQSDTAIQRQVKTPRLSWADRAVLAALARLLPRSQLRQLQLIISPRTLLRWHANLVRRHWVHPRRGPGRPRTAATVRALVLEMARDNPGWG
jgi:hypothetical protein